MPMPPALRRTCAMRDPLRRHRLLEALAAGESFPGAARKAGYANAQAVHTILLILRKRHKCRTTIELVVKYREGEIGELYKPGKKRNS